MAADARCYLHPSARGPDDWEYVRKSGGSDEWLKIDTMKLQCATCDGPAAFSKAWELGAGPIPTCQMRAHHTALLYQNKAGG